MLILFFVGLQSYLPLLLSLQISFADFLGAELL